MRIALVNMISPFIRGGAEILVDDLMHQLQLRGHTVELYRLPSPNDFGLLMARLIEASKMLRFDHYDRVICFKFPAYCVIHRNRVVWMFHQFRQAYELWNTEFGIEANPQNEIMRNIVMHADTALVDSRQLFTIAHEVTNRLKKFNNIDSTVLPHLGNMEKFGPGKTGSYLFFPSRISSIKRQHLAVEAMHYVKSDVKLVVAGVCEVSAYDLQIRSFIKKHHLEEHVQYENRWISDEEMYQWMSNCLGSMYLAYKEDSCGLVSMEAFYSAKPVITCIDSGGTIELIEDQKTGFICEPTPQSIAKAMDQLYMDKQAAAKMGQAARDEIIRRDITWDNTIRRLLA
ncbi:MAG: glycosyltransferase family 4 protein [Eubacteriales bacterium]|nr:glycosyltransferase family 4 protein [Eubacteriales bacterium]